MSEKVFKIVGNYWKSDKCFPSLNDLLSEACRNPKDYGRMKHSYENVVIDAVRTQIRGYKANGKVMLDILWGEPKKTPHKRDEDNVIAGGRKIIHDALKTLGVIEDDNPDYIIFGRNKVLYTDDEPFIEVHIVEIEPMA